MKSLCVIPIEGVGEVGPGDDLTRVLVEATPTPMRSGDVLVVAQKVVSKAEGRLVAEDERASALMLESRRILRSSAKTTICETHHGFVCANAGIDASNVPEGQLALLPIDPDLSARRLRAGILQATDVDVAVIIADTFGRPWRLGQTNVAIGLAGMKPFIDHRGRPDRGGRVMHATLICVADELAAAGEMVMGKADGVCAAIVRDALYEPGRGSAAEIIRPAGDDLFR